MLSADEKAAWQDIAYPVGPKFIAEKFFALYLMNYGMKFVALGQGQVSPSSYLYVSHARMAVPIGGLLLFLQSVTMMGRAMLDFLEYDVSE